MPRRPLQIDESAGPLAVLRAAAVRLPALSGVLAAYVALAAVTLVSQDLGNLLSIPVNAYAVTAAYRALGGEPSGDNSFGVRVLLAVVAGVVAGLAILVGLVLLVLPGLFLVVALRLVVASVMLADSGPIEAQGRSLSMTTSHFWTVLGVAAVPLLVLLAVGVPTALATGGLSLDGSYDLTGLRLAGRVAGAAATLVAQPVVVTANAVMFALYGPDDLGA